MNTYVTTSRLGKYPPLNTSANSCQMYGVTGKLQPLLNKVRTIVRISFLKNFFFLFIHYILIKFNYGEVEWRWNTKELKKSQSNVNVWTAVQCLFWFVSYWHMQKCFDLVRVIEGINIKEWSEGKWKLLRVSGRFELWRVLVAEIKICSTCTTEIQGKSILVRVSVSSISEPIELNRTNRTQTNSIHLIEVH